MVGLTLGALLGSAGDQSQAKGPNGHVSNHGGRQAGNHMSNSGRTNSNAQWSADPSRGWVRAEERSDLKKPSSTAERGAVKGKAKAKGN